MKITVWEYKIYDDKDGVNVDDETGLNFLGEEGWELTAISKSHSPYGGHRYYFKRPKVISETASE